MTQQMQFKKTVSADDSGFQYERKMTTLVALRLYNTMDEFFLGNNFDKAGKFDDLVFRARRGEDWSTCFVQLKHKQLQSLKKKITSTALKSGVKGNCDYFLEKYLESFIEVVKKYYQESKDVIFSGGFPSWTFFIFTNAILHEEILQKNPTKVNISFLSTNPQNEINIRFDPMKDLQLFPTYSKNNKEWCEEFMKKLIFCSGQASENLLDSLIEEEVKKTSQLSTVELNYIMGQLKDFFNHWYNGGKFLVKADIQKILSRSSAEANAGKREELNIKYAGPFLKVYHDVFKSGGLHGLTCKADNTKLCMAALKQLGLLDEPNKLISLKNLERPEIQDHLLNGNLNGALVVDCEADLLGMDIVKFTEFIKELNIRKPKNLVLVVTNVNSKVLNGFPGKKRAFNCTLANLADESRNLLLECCVSFQGCKTSLVSLLAGTKTLDDVFDMAAMTNLLVGRELNVGIKPVEQIPYYVTRVLTRFSITSTVFTSSPQNVKIAVSGLTFEQASKVIPIAPNSIVSDVDVFRNGSMGDAKVIIMESTSAGLIFKRLAAIVPNLHWLSYTGSKNKLSWKASMGNIRQIFPFLDSRNIEYVPTDNIMEIEDRMVIISAEPGMGKSTLLTHLAAETKRLCPNIWVVSLCLNDYTVYFANPKFMDNIETNVKNMVALAAGASAETSKFDARLFNYCYDVTRNMVVLLDGFDEITPYHTKEGMAVMHVLMRTKVARVWVTTRPQMRSLLQNEFSVFSYSIRPFGDSDQKNFFIKYWKERIPDIQNETLLQFIEKLMKLIKTSFDAEWNIFTGIPLQTRMIAEVFNSELRSYHETGTLGLPNAINGLQLFHAFVLRKLEILMEEKLKIGNTNAVTQSLKKTLMETHERFLMQLALLTILPAAKCAEISPPITEGDVNKLKQQVSSEGDRTGIVISFKADTPQFIHRTFAEYFVAKFFSLNFTENRKFLLSADFSSDAFNFVRYFFDRILAGESKIHKAVLDRDMEALKAGIKAKIDVNLKDQGGRTALHVAACLPDTGEIIRILLQAGAEKSVRDSIMKWLPLEYAVRSQCLTNIAPLVDGPSSYPLIKDVIPISCDSVKMAVAGDYLPVLLYLLEKGITSVIGIEVLPKNSWKEGISCNGFTLLHLAAVYNAQSIVQYLLRSDTRDSKVWIIERKDASGKTPLMLAVSSGSFEVAKLLLTAGAQLPDHKPDEKNLVQIAVESRNSELFQLLLTIAKERKISPDWFLGALSSLVVDKSRWASIALLAIMDEFPLLRDCKTDKQIPFLIAACIKGNEACVEILVSKGANVNVTHNGRTPVLYAVQGGHENVLKTLLKAPGIDTEAVDPDGCTALYVAVAKGLRGIFNLLVNHGANLKCIYEGGNNLSHAVCISCDQDIFKSLIAKGVDFRLKNDAGFTALDLLKTRNKDDMVQQLNSLLPPTIAQVYAEPPQKPPSVNTVPGKNTKPIKQEAQSSSESEVDLEMLKEKLGEDSPLYKNLVSTLAKLKASQQGTVNQQGSKKQNSKPAQPQQPPIAKAKKKKNKAPLPMVVPSPNALISPPIPAQKVPNLPQPLMQKKAIPPLFMKGPFNQPPPFFSSPLEQGSAPANVAKPVLRAEKFVGFPAVPVQPNQNAPSGNAKKVQVQQPKAQVPNAKPGNAKKKAGPSQNNAPPQGFPRSPQNKPADILWPWAS